MLKTNDNIITLFNNNHLIIIIKIQSVTLKITKQITVQLFDLIGNQ